MREIKRDNWAGGANNLAPADRLPQPSRNDATGFVRAAINLDPTPGGQLHLRIGHERVYTGTAVRGVLGLRDRLLIADGAQLVELNTRTRATRVLRAITSAGPFVGDELNGILYVQTANEALQYDGDTVKPWGVPDVWAQPLPAVTTGGSLLAGTYRMAVTFSDAAGVEGGTDQPLIVTVPAMGALDVELPAPPAGGRVNLYLGFLDSQTLYLQDSREAAGPVRVSAVRDDTRTLTTALLCTPPIGHLIRAHGSQLAIASGEAVWLTEPMRPHLCDRKRGFFQFPARVGDLLSDGPLFVSADKTYGLRGIESDAPEQYEALEFPLLPGSAVTLPDGRGAAMTRYGQAVVREGGLALVNRDHYAPAMTERGAACVVEHNGNQIIVTATRGPGDSNPLATTHSNGEIYP